MHLLPILAEAVVVLQDQALAAEVGAVAGPVSAEGTVAEAVEDQVVVAMAAEVVTEAEEAVVDMAGK